MCPASLLLLHASVHGRTETAYRYGTPDEHCRDYGYCTLTRREERGRRTGQLCGDPCQYFYQGGRREHPAWDSLCFDYGKNEVIHFLLSNCKYWLEEFHFDGFRFDGVTSMLYYSHGLGEAFCNYGDYFNGHQDDNAICYLTLANG